MIDARLLKDIIKFQTEPIYLIIYLFESLTEKIVFQIPKLSCVFEYHQILSTNGRMLDL